MKFLGYCLMCIHIRQTGENGRGREWCMPRTDEILLINMLWERRTEISYIKLEKCFFFLFIYFLEISSGGHVFCKAYYFSSRIFQNIDNFFKQLILRVATKRKQQTSTYWMQKKINRNDDGVWKVFLLLNLNNTRWVIKNYKEGRKM